jgi:hypothetical protein
MPCESIGEQAESATSGRNLGTAEQACAVAGIKSYATLRNWLRKRLISAVRVGNGPYLYDLDDCARMRVTYPRADADEAINELIANAPEFTPEQINRIRLLLHSAPSGGDA